MEHLPTPVQPLHPPLRIPYIVTREWEYDNAGFKEFPSRKGVNIERLRNGQFEGRTWHETLSFLQSWLFFGLLVELFKAVDIIVHNDDFLSQTEDGSQFITTALLPRLIVMWEARERESSIESKKNRLAIVDEYLSQLRRFIHRDSAVLWNREEAKERKISLEGRIEPPATELEIHISLTTLGEALGRARYLIYYLDRRFRPKEDFTVSVSIRLFDDLLVAAGWCPFEITVLSEQLPNSSKYYLYMVDRSQGSEKHQHCSTSHCVLNTVDEDTYQSIHISNNCKCPHFVSQTSPQDQEALQRKTDVSSVLESGYTPLVLVCENEDGREMVPKIISSKNSGLSATINHHLMKHERESYSSWPVKNEGSKAQLPYVAISHVWSGGLGNPHNNSLPRCQLNRIQKLVNDLYSPEHTPVPFWIDTLCVPLEPRERALAIRGMKSVYQEADKVLVLDTTLQSVVSVTDPLESLMRIQTSPWMQRLWTFQEGITASTLVFQFSGVTVLGEELIRCLGQNQRESLSKVDREIASMMLKRMDPTRARKIRARNFVIQILRLEPNVKNPLIRRSPEMLNTVAQHAISALRDIRFAHSNYTGTLLKKKSEGLALAQLCHVLKLRRTSRARDEALVLTYLLGIDSSSFKDLRNEITVKAVLRMLKSVPKGLLFLARKHIPEYPCGWMPESFLNGENVFGYSTIADHPEWTASVDAGSLRVNCPAIILDGTIRPTADIRIEIEMCLYEIRILFGPQERQGIDGVIPSSTKYVVILEKQLTKLSTILGALVKVPHIIPSDQSALALWEGVVALVPKNRGTTLQEHHSGRRQFPRCGYLVAQEWRVC